ncbi:glutathione peroxidase [Flavobacterium sp.]|uniref:glutathione peroxidase n=1 Tax=Flavobacterium sp. TaxID=239 RepID=UPI00286E651D|nr:glutathione peroxidase [Flavobacterium sp.]
MKNVICIIVLSTFISCIGQSKKSEEINIESQKNSMMKESIHQFKVKDIEGKEFDLASLKGKKVMLVNTASECGLTPQYVQLQELYTTFKEKNFVIIGFPANNFGSQEPGSNVQIATFCSKNYGVTFPMMEKISVKGDDMNPLYQFLTQKSRNGLEDNEVKWNFQKYLINKEGFLEKVIPPTTSPIDDEIVNWVKS